MLLRQELPREQEYAKALDRRDILPGMAQATGTAESRGGAMNRMVWYQFLTEELARRDRAHRFILGAVGVLATAIWFLLNHAMARGWNASFPQILSQLAVGALFYVGIMNIVVEGFLARVQPPQDYDTSAKILIVLARRLHRFGSPTLQNLLSWLRSTCYGLAALAIFSLNGFHWWNHWYLAVLFYCLVGAALQGAAVFLPRSFAAKGFVRHLVGLLQGALASGEWNGLPPPLSAELEQLAGSQDPILSGIEPSFLAKINSRIWGAVKIAKTLVVLATLSLLVNSSFGPQLQDGAFAASVSGLVPVAIAALLVTMFHLLVILTFDPTRSWLEQFRFALFTGQIQPARATFYYTVIEWFRQTSFGTATSFLTLVNKLGLEELDAA